MVAFKSALLPNEPVIGDHNEHLFAPNQGMWIGGELRGRGRVPRDYQANPLGSMPHGKSFDLPLIDEAEWPERIKDMQDNLLSTMLLKAGIPSKDQDGTNYCWFHAVVTAYQARRCWNNLPYIPICAASGAAQVKGFSNSGGWGGEALEWMIEHGINTTKEWPENAIKRTYLTEANKAVAMTRQISEWVELQNRNYKQQMTMLLNYIPVAIGLNWWRHEVCAIDPVVLSQAQIDYQRQSYEAEWKQARLVLPGRFSTARPRLLDVTREERDAVLAMLGAAFGSRIRNSWSDSYGDKGFAILTQSKATHDDGCCVTVVEATAA